MGIVATGYPGTPIIASMSASIDRVRNQAAAAVSAPAALTVFARASRPRPVVRMSFTSNARSDDRSGPPIKFWARPCPSRPARCRGSERRCASAQASATPAVDGATITVGCGLRRSGAESQRPGSARRCRRRSSRTQENDRCASQREARNGRSAGRRVGEHLLNRARVAPVNLQVAGESGQERRVWSAARGVPGDERLVHHRASVSFALKGRVWKSVALAQQSQAPRRATQALRSRPAGRARDHGVRRGPVERLAVMEAGGAPGGAESVEFIRVAAGGLQRLGCKQETRERGDPRCCDRERLHETLRLLREATGPSCPRRAFRRSSG
jgi:hypothetical protein